MRSSRLLVSFLLVASPTLSSGLVAQSAPARSPVGVAERSVNGDAILRDIRELASDRFQGRAVGTAGEDSATAYISRRFREIGLSPAGDDGSYIQRVPMIGTTSRLTAQLSIGGTSLSLKPLDDIIAWSQRASETVNIDSTGIVFVGYGVVAPELGWDDFKGVDVRGKTVLVLVGDPPVPDPKDSTRLDPATFRGVAMTYYGRWTYKYEMAAARGAAAVLLVHQTGPAGYAWGVVQANDRERLEVVGGPAHTPIEGWIHLDATKRIFSAAGLDFLAIERQARTRGFQPVTFKGTATFHVQNRVRQFSSRNVVATLAGSDAQVRGEAVLLSAHWDTFGIGRPINGDSIYNGALDDASGVAWLLAAATAARALPTAPRRTLVFAAVTAEEAGLLGARYYAQHPVVPLARTLANVNMDAMNPWGRTRSIVSLGFGQSSLEELLAREAAKDQRVVKADPEPEKGYFYRADHLELARAGVPALSFLFPGIDYIGRSATYGDSVRAVYLARDYHKPTDEVKADWDMAGIVDDTRLTIRVALDIANGRVWPTWNAGSEFRAAREASLRAPQKR
jgi:Zn-dependent M28 family amino/carboxypeptidase